VQKICRVCSRGSVRQDAKLPVTRGREKDVASAIVVVDECDPVLNQPHGISTEEGVRTRGREDVDVPPLTAAKARAGETGMFEGRRSVEASGGE
jgi:hypothetical protein